MTDISTDAPARQARHDGRGGALAKPREFASRGELKAARDAYADVLRVDRKNVDAWLELGRVCERRGAAGRALKCYQNVFALDAKRWQARLASARLLERAGHDDQAAVQYFLAVSLAGNGAGLLSEIHYRMGRSRLEAGRPGRALECFRQALSCARQDPDRDQNDRVHEVLIDLGDALAQTGMLDDANRVFAKACSANGKDVLERLARTAYRNNLWQQAIAALRRNVELRPESSDASYKLAQMMVDSGQLADALAELERDETTIPESAAASLRAGIARKMGDTATAFDLHMGLVEAGHTGFASNTAMGLLYSDRMSPDDVFALHKRLFGALGEGARSRDSFVNDRNPDRRLHVGLVTGDLHRQHPVDILLQPMLKQLSHERVHTTVYYVGATHDEKTRLAQSRVDAWRRIAGAGLGDFRRQVDVDRIDVMIDLAGHTGSAMNFFAQRLAPVQATYLGYPGTTGVPNMDWIIADAEVVPPEHDKLYSEVVLRLPNTVFCFAPEAEYPFPQFADAALDRPLTFGSFNNIPKITPSTVRLWPLVLHAVDGSRLILKGPGFDDAATIERYKGLFAAEGIGEERLQFRGPVGLAAAMAEYADIDIALDPVPYTGGATTLQALWMGAPVVTKRGGSFVQRMGASFMGAADLGDWVADDDDGYVAIAVAKASDRDGLLALKRGLRERLLACPAWDIERYTRDFEAGLRQMWRQWCTSRV